MLERIIEKEKLAKHLAGLNDQQLLEQNYPKRYRDFLNRNMQAVAALGASGIAIGTSGIVLQNFSMAGTGFVAEIAGVVTGIIVLTRKKRLAKIAGMAANEALFRGIDIQNKTPSKAQEPATPAG